MRALVGEEHTTRAVCVELKLQSTSMGIPVKCKETARVELTLSGISPREFPQRPLRLKFD